jgi:hypothetical protein
MRHASKRNIINVKREEGRREREKREKRRGNGRMSLIMQGGHKSVRERRTECH